ncbi:MAG: hypothetical protein N2112_05235 [Gemmataceae bacterium]|jgi:hypothetical protein|nr:hypothetical protein [Gemmataceae bacterium]
MKPHLKLFPPPQDEELIDSEHLNESPPPKVHIRLRDLLPVLALAQRLNFLWLKDFLDDEICISEDLNDIIQAIRGIKPAS